MDSRQIFDFEQRLKLQLAGSLPGPMVQRQLAPELAFGRHRGPIPAEARQAAVLMLVHPFANLTAFQPTPRQIIRSDSKGNASDEWAITAIVRPAHMKFHPGQIALPGGMVEPGETPLEAALREFEEELGTTATAVNVLGQLTPVFVFASGAAVTPFVAFSPNSLQWQPNPAEVESVLEIPLSELLKPTVRGKHTIRRGLFTMKAPHFSLAGQHVWGATAMILSEFAAVCSAARMNLSPQPPMLTPDAT